jgi:glutamate/tyrosine decarboxylase-like PLP-dependent enzyme
MRTVESPFRKPLEAALENAMAHLGRLDEASVAATVDIATLRSRIDKILPQAGVPAEQVIADLVKDVEGGILGSAGGRFFGWVIGGSVPAALAADWLTSAWDQNSGHHSCGPAAAVVEEVAGKWLKEILGLPASASFALVTGCQMAHVTCLAAARHAVLSKRGWDPEKQGLYAAPPIRILTSDARHETFDRAIRLLGLGLQRVEYLPADSDGQLPADALERALNQNGSEPTIVLLQAGDVNTGKYDSFEGLIPIAKRHNAWVHIDGAFGLWAAASAEYRHLVKGVSEADSWATDGHKWLNVPYDCGYAFVAHPDAHRASMTSHASYLTRDGDVRDQMDWTPEWSRRARAFPTYAALRQLGRGGVSDLVERCCQHAYTLVMEIGRLPGAEVVSKPVINQGLVRFLDLNQGASEADHDRRTDQVIAAILATGEAFFGGTTWRGRRAMRVSVSNWLTSQKDVERVVSAVAKALTAAPVHP